MCNVENPTSDFASISTSDQRYFNVDPTLKCWLGKRYAHFLYGNESLQLCLEKSDNDFSPSGSVFLTSPFFVFLSGPETESGSWPGFGFETMRLAQIYFVVIRLTKQCFIQELFWAHHLGNPSIQMITIYVKQLD